MGQEVYTIDMGIPLQFEQLLAQGAVGLVYEARMVGTRGFSKRVAVKMLKHQDQNFEALSRLLADEAKLVSNLVHENIVQTWYLGESEDQELYIVMEFVDGISLSEFFHAHRSSGLRIRVPLIVHMVSRMARGLAYAHRFRDAAGEELGIVHRDICLANAMVTLEGQTKIADWGVAKARNMMDLEGKWLVGKLPYMSPEQARAEPLDFRTDIFSLGAVLFELLSHEPIRRVDPNVPVAEWLNQPIPWDSLPGDLDRELVQVLRRMLAYNPEERFQDTDTLASALEYYIYKDGYGPTIKTVEEYLREHFPDLYPASSD